MVIGLAGGTCSGKSTFARLIGESIGSVRVIGLDAFYTRDMENGPTLTLSDGTHMFNFNHPAAIDAGKAAEAIRTCEEPVVIVEGLFTLAIPTVRELIDGPKVFIHLDADLRALRRMLRDMKGGRQSTDPDFIARYYVECARVGHAQYVEPSRELADFEIIGDAEGMGSGLERLLAAIQ